MDNNISLVKYLASTGLLKSPLIVEAFQKIDRINFVRPEYRARAYEDKTLQIGAGQTISKPSEVAHMLELLKPQRGNKILDLGTGSGWTTALLAHITGYTGFVYGVEIMPELLDMSRRNINTAQLKNVIVEPASQTLGLPEHAPYDRILVSAYVSRIPEELINQLGLNGVMVGAVNDKIVRVKKDANGQINEETFNEHNLDAIVEAHGTQTKEA